MAKKISVGIDIGTHTTRVTVLEYTNQEEYPSILGSGSSATAGVRLGYITNIKQASDSIRRAVRNAEKNCGDIKIKKAYVSIGGISLLSVASIGSTIISKADGEITTLDVSKALANSEENLEIPNRKIIQSYPIAYKLDGKEIHGHPEGMRGIKLEVKAVYVTCLKQNIEDLVTAFAEVNIEIIDIIPSQTATGIAVLSEKQKMAGSALIDIGAETVSLSVFENNMPISLIVFPIGGMDITKDIALGFRIDLEEAENVKIGSLLGNFPKKKVDEIIEARLGDVFELVENHLKRIKKNGLLPAGVTIIGGGSYIQRIDELAKRDLRLPARIGPIDISVNSKYKVKDASWYTSLGLALYSKNNISSDEINPLRGNIKQVKGFFKSILSQLLP
ncbi:MAG: hypothetical protein RL687_377 [Candidatus Parcubacteria bacterium]|jgi:cell division protein FtsA